MKTLTLRLSDEEAEAIEDLKKALAEPTASKAVLWAATNYHALVVDIQVTKKELVDARFERNTLQTTIDRFCAAFNSLKDSAFPSQQD